MGAPAPGPPPKLTGAFGTFTWYWRPPMSTKPSPSPVPGMARRCGRQKSKLIDRSPFGSACSTIGLLRVPAPFDGTG